MRTSARSTVPPGAPAASGSTSRSPAGCHPPIRASTSGIAASARSTASAVAASNHEPHTPTRAFVRARASAKPAGPTAAAGRDGLFVALSPGRLYDSRATAVHATLTTRAVQVTGGADEALLLARPHGRRGAAVIRRRAGAHFDEDQRAAVEHHEVDLAGAAAIVALEQAQAP